MSKKPKPPYFEITAACLGPYCEGHTFKVYREKATYRPTSGGPERAKSKVVCPRCRCWADVIDIMKVTQEGT